MKPGLVKITAGMTRRQVEALFREHDDTECLEDIARISTCKICGALNAQFISALRQIMGVKPLSGTGEDLEGDVVRFADFGGADVETYSLGAHSLDTSGRRIHRLAASRSER